MSRLSPWRQIANALVLAVNMIAGAALVLASYAGEFSPAERPMMGVVVLGVPIALAAIVVLLILDFVWWRKTALVPIVAIVASWPTVWSVCPLNIGTGIPGGTPPERVFTLLTYNVLSMRDNTAGYSGDVNPTLSYILRQDADVVCLQELSVLNLNKKLKITQAQLDSIHARYPYIILSGTAVAVMSKYPIENLHLDSNSGVKGSRCDMGGYVLNVEGHRLALFNVHLQSFKLTRSDKEAYDGLTHLRHEEDINELGHTLVGKIKTAAVRRAGQAQMLCRYIDYYGGENVIVTGDFNDAPGCYTLRQLADLGLREVWPEVGFGPTWTYNDHRLYFRIDHILWRGRLRPAGIRRGNVRWSDHYPLIATFVWDNDESNQ